ncbi:chain length determinant protein [Rufibacter latericius]|uniref:Chain length determinant protein n=1 Tax=Rufibacter latericius TaxID=2487040 RepID=A0A3M9MCX7_9BACT|nr:chain length determinant protein [Rufibacter latericius]RNI22448.1 chain length determinant protein [Rufibacter latericius]
MNRISPREERSADEIDLRVVFDKIGSFLKKVFHLIKSAFLLVLRRWPLFLLITLLGIGLGYVDFFLKRPFYKSFLTLAPAEIRNEFFEDQVNRLAVLILDGNVDQVATDLKISPEDASKVKSIRYVNIDHNRVAEDSIMTGAPFRLDVELYDKTYFPPFQKAIVSYLDSNPFFTKSTQAKKEQIRSMIEKLRIDIASIDSIKRTAVSLRGPANGFVYGEPLDPTELYKQSAELFEKQAYLESQLRKMETIQVVVGFAPLIHPTGPKVKIHLALGAVLGFVGAFILVLWYEYKLRQRKRRLAQL